MTNHDVFRQLTEVNLDDFVEAFGVGGNPLLACTLRLAGRPAARAFARTTLRMDAVAGCAGTRAGASWGLRAMHTTLNVEGASTFPREGPVLVLANHPGMTDSIALMSAIPRDDVRIIAARRPFLELLPYLSRSLIWVDADAAASLATLREASAHLRAGGVLLTFPAGKIEPDPGLLATERNPSRHALLHNTIRDSLYAWNPSGDLLARSIPDVQIVSAFVSGVIAPAAAHSPLRSIRRTAAGRDQLSAMLQIFVPAMRNVTATVRLAPPLPVQAIGLQGKRRASVTRTAIEIMSTMMGLCRGG